MRFSVAAFALLLCCLAAHAQRGGGAHGGGHGAGFGGGFHGAPMGGGRAGFGGAGRGFAPGRGFGGGAAFGRSYSGAFGNRSNPSRGYGSAFSLRSPGYGQGARYRGTGLAGFRQPGFGRPGLGRPGFGYPGFHRPGYGFSGYGRYPYHRYSTGLRFFYGAAAYPAFVDLSFLNPYWNYADLYEDDQTFTGPQAGAYGDAYPQAGAQSSEAYGEPANPYAPATPNVAADHGAYPGESAQSGERAANQGDVPMVYAPYVYGQPAPQQGQVTVVTLPSPQREADAITLFYRDGRPPEQVRNYALTRTALLITGPRLREIPLAELDLPLTERVNKAAGVDFQLPQR